jgi:hypothetical protein
MSLRVTIEFPNEHNGKPVVRKDVEGWALATMRATEGFTNIKLKLVAIEESAST